MVASGLALADHIVGDAGNNRLVGTPGKDTISGAGGHDDILARAVETGCLVTPATMISSVARGETGFRAAWARTSSSASAATTSSTP